MSVEERGRENGELEAMGLRGIKKPLKEFID
jgi:hypothetical protein